MEIKGIDGPEQEKSIPEFVVVNMTEDDKEFAVNTAKEARSLI